MLLKSWMILLNDPVKCNNGKEWNIYHYRFFNNAFNIYRSICDGCHDLTVLSGNKSGIAIFKIKDADYRCIFHPAINLLKNSVL